MISSPIRKCYHAGRPVPHRQFDGKIHIERVSKKRFIQKCTAHTNFCDDALLNSEIVSGKWKHLVSEDLHINVSEVKQLIYEYYDLEEAVVDRLELSYKTKIGKSGNEKLVVIEDDGRTLESCKIRKNDDSNIPAGTIIIDDIELKVRQQIGDEVEEDASCDSEFMLTAMNRVGKAIWDKYHWVPNEQKCYLVMDNAGGHGTNTAIATYTKMLEDDYNIEIIFQIPRSP